MVRARLVETVEAAEVVMELRGVVRLQALPVRVALAMGLLVGALVVQAVVPTVWGVLTVIQTQVETLAMAAMGVKETMARAAVMWVF